MEDIRSEVPAKISRMLLSEERVYFYATPEGWPAGSKTFIAVTDARVIGAAEKPTGCLGMKETVTVDIPLEHVSSVKTTASGCLLSGVGTLVVSSGTASNTFIVGKPEGAQRAATIIQQAMRDVRKR